MLQLNYSVLLIIDDLEIQVNELSGTIPDELYNAVLLERLSIGENDLSGTVSTKIGNLTKLTGLFMQGTSLSGEIPTEVGLMKEISEFRARQSIYWVSFWPFPW